MSHFDFPTFVTWLYIVFAATCFTVSAFALVAEARNRDTRRHRRDEADSVATITTTTP